MRTLLILGTCCALASTAHAQASKQAKAHTKAAQAIVAMTGSMTWVAGPANLPAGAKLAVLEGSPAKPGPFTIRLSLPANYRIPPHFHPGWEHVTVIEGSFNVGMGKTFDTAGGTTLTTGSFGALPPGMRHFAWTTEPAVLQLHGQGPWRLIYVNPADDPSRKP